MSEVQSGLEGVVAFATTIAEPDREGGALRYRGVDLEELAGRVPFEHVWGLLVDGALAPGLAAAEPPRPAACARGDTRARRPGRRRGPRRELEPLIDSTDERRATTSRWISALTLDFVAQSARGADLARGADAGRRLARGAVPRALARRGRPGATRGPSTPTGSRRPSTG